MVCRRLPHPQHRIPIFSRGKARTRPYHCSSMLCCECSRHFQHEYKGVLLKDLGKVNKNVPIWTQMPGRYVKNQARKGCEICTRLCIAVSYLGDFFCSSTDDHPLQSHDPVACLNFMSSLRFCTVSWEPKAITSMFESPLRVSLADLKFDLRRCHEGE